MTLSKEIEEITTEEILKALGNSDVSTQDILKTATYYYTHVSEQTTLVKPKEFGRIIAQMANRMMRMEEALEKGRPMDAGPPQRIPRTKSVVPTVTEGVMHKNAVEAGLPPDLEVGKVVDVACPECGHQQMKLKTTRDNARSFLSCLNWARNDPNSCKGSMSYKSYK